MSKFKLQPTTVFIVILILFLFGYLYSSFKIVVFNHSGNEIKKITINAEYLQKTLENVKDKEISSISIFSPFDKKVHVKVFTENSILSSTFNLKGILLGEKLNQVEIGMDGNIKAGALGLKQ